MLSPNPHPSPSALALALTFHPHPVTLTSHPQPAPFTLSPRPQPSASPSHEQVGTPSTGNLTRADMVEEHTRRRYWRLCALVRCAVNSTHHCCNEAQQAKTCTDMQPRDLTDNGGYEVDNLRRWVGFLVDAEGNRARQDEQLVNCSYFVDSPDQCSMYTWVSADPRRLCCACGGGQSEGSSRPTPRPVPRPRPHWGRRKLRPLIRAVDEDAVERCASSRVSGMISTRSATCCFSGVLSGSHVL